MEESGGGAGGHFRCDLLVTQLIGALCSLPPLTLIFLIGADLWQMHVQPKQLNQQNDSPFQ